MKVIGDSLHQWCHLSDSLNGLPFLRQEALVKWLVFPGIIPRNLLSADFHAEQERRSIVCNPPLPRQVCFQLPLRSARLQYRKIDTLSWHKLHDVTMRNMPLSLKGTVRLWCRSGWCALALFLRRNTVPWPCVRVHTLASCVQLGCAQPWPFYSFQMMLGNILEFTLTE